MTATTPDLRPTQRRIVLTLSLAQLCSGIGNGAALAIGSLMAVELTGSDAYAGAVTTALSVAASLAALPLAGLAMRRGRRTALMSGLGLAAVGAVAMILAPVLGSFAVLLLGGALLGVGNAANLQSRFAATDLATPAHRGRDLSIVVWAITIGAVAGPNLIRPGAALGEFLGLPEMSGPFLFSLAGMLIGVVVLAVGLRPDPLLTARAVGGVSGGASRPSLVDGLRTAARSWPATLGIVTLVAAHVVMVAVMSMTPVQLRELDHAAGAQHSSADTLAVIGFVISLHIAGMYALSPVMGWLTDRFGRLRTMLLAQVLLAAAVLCAGVGADSRTWVTVGLVLLGLGWSAATVSASTFVAESVPPERAVLVQGVSDAVMGAAGAVGAATAGMVLAVGGYLGVNLVGAVTVAVVAVLIVATMTRTRTRPLA
ncbi:MFS transporter [Rhodococcus sp. NPDC058532]|uniref:MFS transporter n=1 Tax=Rhodococcus sp. NPDC058532 TaxID=3346540 RepID=UPI003649D639